MKHQGVAIELFNLIKNENGFEKSIGAGTKQDLERLRLDFERKNTLNQEAESKQAWERVSYYIVPKRDWDVDHCPLMPVDFS